MKKIIIFVPILFFLIIFLFGVKNVIASGTAYTDSLGFTHYSNGSTSYTDSLGFTHFSGGGSAYSDSLGFTHYNNLNGNSGTIYTDSLGFTHDSNRSTSYTDSLGFTHLNGGLNGSSGTAYTDSLGFTHYDGDIFIINNCPSNSSYDSLSKKCECNSGYIVSGSSCIYKPYTPTYIPSYTPTYTSPSFNQNTCPLNSYSSNGSCYCSTGYKLNSNKTSCIVVPVKTNEQICQDSFGLNVIWDGTKNSDNTLNCNCKTSYEWATDRKSCVKIIPLVIPKPASVSSSKKIVATQTEEEKKKQNSETQTKIGNEVLAEFIKEHPEYAPENDPNDVRWNLFKEKITFYDWSNKTTEQLKEIFESIHKNITEQLKINPEPEKKVKWYQRIFNWFVK